VPVEGHRPRITAEEADALLLQAIRQAPRPYRMPPLPATAAEAERTGPDAMLAYAIDALRAAVERGAHPAAELRGAFTRALAQSIEAALQPEGGDASFQALVLQRLEPLVREYVQLAARWAADRRAVRSAINAVAHPGKLRHLAGSDRDHLTRLHELSTGGDWPALEVALNAPADPVAGGANAAIDSPAALESLRRLARATALQSTAPVGQYLALCSARGPLAGSPQAALAGRSSARAGGQAEQHTLQAFTRIAGLLEDACGGRERYRAIRGLHTPAGFPAGADKAKDEWDAAILAFAPGSDEATRVVLLAEVKAAPAAAVTDYWRLWRGLQRLARATSGAVHEFPSSAGPVAIRAEALQRLQPAGDALPAQVVYCCPAPPPAPVPLLGPAGKAVLLAEEASLAFAARMWRGERPPPSLLEPVWEALAHAPRLRSALHQFRTATLAREAMLDPQDLLAAVTRLLAAG